MAIQVFVYKLQLRDDSGAILAGQPNLHQDCSHSGHVLALYLKSHGDYIVVGDLLRSVTLLRMRSEDGKLEEAARDFSSNFMRAVEFIVDNDDFFLGTDDYANLFILRRRLDASTEEERAKLEGQGEFHLGDYVNVIRKGSLTRQPDTADVKANNSDGLSTSLEVNLATGTSAKSSSYLFGTISGSIGTILTLSEEVYKFFSALEKSVKSCSTGLGLSHGDWRSFHNERKTSPQRNVVDGDLVESFLDFSRDVQDVIVKQLNDELNAMKTPIAPVTASSYNMSSSTLSSVLMSEEKVISHEEVLQRVEDMVRLH